MQEKKEFEGIYSLGKNGIAYIKNKENGDVIEVPSHHSNSALHKDIVRVRITKPDTKEGEIITIINRAQTGFVGILSQNGKEFTVKPDNFKIPDIMITSDPETTKHLGETVFVIIDSYEPTLQGHIDTYLGLPGSNEANMRGIALEQGFDYRFPQAVTKEAEALEALGIPGDEIAGRKDLRDVLTFTIDPEDAKDFDDALSFRTLENGHLEIGVHIADVAHYVRPGTTLDTEAQKRTTSVYLVDRTIPMLPEALSNGLCSLRQDEDKLAFSAIFEIDQETGAIIEEWFGRSIIRSNKRFTYEEAQDILDTKGGLYYQELLALDTLAKLYTEQRYQAGALNFETHEVKFILDDTGKPISVKVKERIDTNKLIEEFMLLANHRVAKFMKKAPFFVYRVHDAPDPERMEKLHEFLKVLGYTTHLENGIIPVPELQRIIREAEGQPVYETLQTVIVRSMQKAIYTTRNIGHFGLAMDDYTHFTSPIRRYPDVLAHRLLQHALDQTESPLDQSWHEKMCHHSSEQEGRAVNAERGSIKLKQVEYMKSKDPDDIFKGVVTGAGKFGVFVAEAESLSEGMIRLSDLGNDRWEYQEKSGIVKGEKSGKTFKIGDEIHLKIKRVDLERRLIDYVLVIDGVSQESAPRRSHSDGKKSSR